MADSPRPDEHVLAALREALPAVAAGIYLDAAAAGPLPAETAAALREADDWELRLGRGGHDRASDVEQRQDEAKAVIAALIPNADPDQVVLTNGPRDGLARIALAAMDRIAPRDGRADVLVARGCFDGAAKVLGPVSGFRVGELHVAELPGALTEATALVVVPMVHRLTGELLDLEPVLSAIGANPSITLVVDATLAAGAIPLTVPWLSAASAVLIAGDRWLLGPEGTGAIRVRRAHDAHRLEVAGERLSRRSLLGLARSVGWLEMFVGLPFAHERTRAVARTLASGLADVAGVELLTPLDRIAAIATFRVRGWDAPEAAEELSHRVHAIVSVVEDPWGAPGSSFASGPRGAIRASVGWWNTEDEVGRFVGGVAQLAAHTPETLPRRPSLIVLPG